MLCINCQTQLPDNASFCLKCGTPQKGNTRFNERKYEYCEIDYEESPMGCLGFIIRYIIGTLTFNQMLDYIFVATSVGPQGRNRLYFTKKFASSLGMPQTKNALANLDALMNHMLKEGWEPTETRGQWWYQYRFRREIT